MSKEYLRQKAIILRREGYSYTDINKKINVSKSTLSNWLSEIPFIPNQIFVDRLNRARILSNQSKHRIKQDSVSRAEVEAKDEIKSLNSRELFFLGLGIYMGEGTKTYDIVRIVNADPRIIRIMILWFKSVFGMRNENFGLRIHLYPDSNLDDAIHFWAKETGLSRSCFLKTQIDLRKNKNKKNARKLPYGTVQLSVKSLGKKDWGVFLARKINAYMAEVYKRC